ncbi:GntR family transcriptional regulator [Streptomyces sp. A3M-1-3]|uniref:GntR family transcriptional regulator n=1 Tax=Streptomyces sp. A3M-1-3 TaxID=2962044 RepID=UPI0020B8C1CD|nr:GntR family transcriptional regulator [Streptomyces sp. A3M-1-3]MCP3821072.1 GntR family transcriptional regulator [Streptomyces sp. A3M-1-3]
MADALRDRIRSGVLRPGDRLPTQARLAEEFGVERGTVRQALRILHDEGLLTHLTKGSPARVADPPAHAYAASEARPLPTTAGLAPRITDAFTARHVEIDALCLTAGTLTLALGEPLRQIHAGRLAPARVDVRILLPSRGITLAFPTPVVDAGGGANPVHRRWLTQRNAQGQVLRHNLTSLRRSHGIDVHVAFRALPFTPPVKLYLLNNTEALFAYYQVARREEEIDHEPLATYDTQGARSMLFAFAQSGVSLRDTTFVEQSQLWFNALWNTISSELDLGL